MRAITLTLSIVLLWLVGLSYAEQMDPPSMELLEFIGMWESPTGEWIDPFELEQAQTPEPKQDHDDE